MGFHRTHRLFYTGIVGMFIGSRLEGFRFGVLRSRVQEGLMWVRACCSGTRS